VPLQLHLRYTICIELVFNKGEFWHLIKFYENFSMGSSLNQSQTYQGNPCGVYPNLSSLSGSGIIQNLWPVSSYLLLVRITSSGIRASALVIGSIRSNFFSLCNLSQVRVLFCYLRSCSRSCLCSCSCFFQILCQKFYLNSVSNYVWGQFGLLEEFRGLGFSRLLNLFAY